MVGSPDQPGLIRESVRTLLIILRKLAQAPQIWSISL